jgi:hypothetical protein
VTANSAILTKVEALLAKAESTPYEAESEAFFAKATELMTKHCIDEAVLHGRATEGRGEVGQTVLIEPSGPYSLAFTSLVDGVALANHCEVIRVPGMRANYLHPRRAAQSIIIGFAEERRHVEMLVDSLLLQLARSLGTPNVCAQRDQQPPRSRAAWNSQFAKAFASRIRHRLEGASAAARQEAEDEHGGEAVEVALRDMADALAEFISDTFGKIGQIHDSSAANAPDAWRAGAAAGDGADIGQQRMPRTRRALPHAAEAAQ